MISGRRHRTLLVLMLIVVSWSPRPYFANVETPTAAGNSLAASSPSNELSPAEVLDVTPANLAKQVLAGGHDAETALLAALQASGIAIRASDDTLTVKPAEPWQGLVYDAWEIPHVAAMVHPQRTVSFALTDLADGLKAAVPGLKDAAVESLLLDDLRAHARSAASPKQFWALFIIELGRQAVAHEPYDLMDDRDSSRVRLDGLQVSLIVRRLAVDLLMLAGPDKPRPKAGAVFWWTVPRAHADSHLPCTLESKERTILDLTALATRIGLAGIRVGDYGWVGLLKDLESKGVAGAGTFGFYRRHASSLLTWTKFIYTYTALKADIDMQSPPLVRTKKPHPVSGDRKTVTAVVKMDVGNAQMFNCFRIMLNALGLDFSVPNDGPLKGAHIAWVGMEGFSGGSEQIVRFVADSKSRIQETGDPSSGRNPVSNQVTDTNGLVRIDVEGIGQRKEISDTARGVPKRARLRVQVAIKGADLFKDVLKAGEAALSGPRLLWTMGAETLYRVKWFSAGHYTVPVVDWVEGLEVVIHGTHKYSGNGMVVLDRYAGRGYLFLRQDGSFDISVPLSINSRQATGVCSDSGGGPGELQLTGSLNEAEALLIFTRFGLSGVESFQGRCPGVAYNIQPFGWAFELGSGQAVPIALKEGAKLAVPPPSEFPWPGDWEMTLELRGEVLPMLE